MPGILKTRFFKLTIAVILIAIAVLLCQYWLAIALLLFLSAYTLNKMTIKKLYKPLTRLSANRKVEKVDTIVIGDMISSSKLSHFCDLSHSMILCAPDRTLKSSFLLLQHLTSRLEPLGNVVIVNRGGGVDDTWLFDRPYLSLISRLENHINEDSYKYRYPFIFSPVRCMVFLLGNPFGCFKEEICTHEGIVRLCRKKSFNLVYLNIHDTKNKAEDRQQIRSVPKEALRRFHRDATIHNQYW